MSEIQVQKAKAEQEAMEKFQKDRLELENKNLKLKNEFYE